MDLFVSRSMLHFMDMRGGVKVWEGVVSINRARKASSPFQSRSELDRRAEPTPLRSVLETVVLSGSLAADDPVALCRALVSIGETDLCVARLVEGHVNARHLLDLYGTGSADECAIHGVWGADGDEPLRVREGRLQGGKRYASGLGTVDRAIVTVAGEADELSRLAVVDVTDPCRHRPETWDMVGMRQTVSGDIDLTGLPFAWLGAPGDYFREPHFLGGVWRIAALQLGGTLGLLGAARDTLTGLGRLDADAQVGRLAPLIARAMAAYGLVERAATVASGPEGVADPDRAVALSIQSRLLTEDLAQDTIAAVERSVGLAHFPTGSGTGRIARDLATYCRQAARDAFEQRAGRIVLSRQGSLATFWHG